MSSADDRDEEEGACEDEDQEEFESEELSRAKEEAVRNRDREGARGQAALVNLWREVSKPRRAGAIPLLPAGCKLDMPALFDEWLAARGLADALTHVKDEEGWAVFEYAREPAVRSDPTWEPAFHGTWWYSVWSILQTGVFLESNDKDLGHDFWEPGVYCSPSLDTALWYARPHVLFGDGVFHRIIFELRVDPRKRKKSRKRGGVQWVFPSSGVSLKAIWVRSNAPPNNGEERVNEWQPELEALPSGCEPVPPTVNVRDGPWPHFDDPFPFELGDTSAPPWLQGTSKTSKSPGGRACAQAAPRLDGSSGCAVKRAPAVSLSKVPNSGLGGLYGHWLKEVRQGLHHPACSGVPGARGGGPIPSTVGGGPIPSGVGGTALAWWQVPGGALAPNGSTVPRPSKSAAVLSRQAHGAVTLPRNGAAHASAGVNAHLQVPQKPKAGFGPGPIRILTPSAKSAGASKLQAKAKAVSAVVPLKRPAEGPLLWPAPGKRAAQRPGW